MLTSEQRKQVFTAAFNVFIQDLERQTGFTLTPVVKFDAKSKTFGNYETMFIVTPIEGWEPEIEVGNENAEKK